MIICLMLVYIDLFVKVGSIILSQFVYTMEVKFGVLMAPLFIDILYVTYDQKNLSRVQHQSLTLLPIVFMVLELYLIDHQKSSLLKSGFYLLLWIYLDFVFDSPTELPTTTYGITTAFSTMVGRNVISLVTKGYVLFALLGLGVVNLYSAGFVPWNGTWIPSFIVVMYVRHRVISFGTTFLRASRAESVFALCTFGLILTWTVFTDVKPITECMAADMGCGFGASIYGTGAEIQGTKCRCINDEWSPRQTYPDSAYQMCLKCSSETHTATKDCCGTDITFENHKNFNCILEGFDQCVNPQPITQN